MRVILADNIAHYAGAFLEAGLRIQPKLAHSEQQSPVHGFSPSRTSGSERAVMVDSVCKMALAQRVVKGYFFNPGSHGLIDIDTST